MLYWSFCCCQFCLNRANTKDNPVVTPNSTSALDPILSLSRLDLLFTSSSFMVLTDCLLSLVVLFWCLALMAQETLLNTVDFLAIDRARVDRQWTRRWANFVCKSTTQEEICSRSDQQVSVLRPQQPSDNEEGNRQIVSRRDFEFEHEDVEAKSSIVTSPLATNLSYKNMVPPEDDNKWRSSRDQLVFWDSLHCEGVVDVVEVMTAVCAVAIFQLLLRLVFSFSVASWNEKFRDFFVASQKMAKSANLATLCTQRYDRAQLSFLR